VGLGCFPRCDRPYSVSTVGQESVRTSRNGAGHHDLHARSRRYQHAAVPRSPAAAVKKAGIMNAGMVALISIAGLGWLGRHSLKGTGPSLSTASQVFSSILGLRCGTLRALCIVWQARQRRFHSHARWHRAGTGIPRLIVPFLPLTDISFSQPTRHCSPLSL